MDFAKEGGEVGFGKMWMGGRKRGGRSRQDTCKGKGMVAGMALDL